MSAKALIATVSAIGLLGGSTAAAAAVASSPAQRLSTSASVRAGESVAPAASEARGRGSPLIIGLAVVAVIVAGILLLDDDDDDDSSSPD